MFDVKDLIGFQMIIKNVSSVILKTTFPLTEDSEQCRLTVV